jgi:hypothetical protein
LVAVSRRVFGDSSSGPVLLRERFSGGPPPLVGDRRELERVCQEQQRAAGPGLTRAEESKIARGVWRDAGAIKPDAVRASFIEVAQASGRSEATCPKSWRHSFATLLRDANVDMLIRQQTFVR